MRLIFKPHPHLPPLGWCVRLDETGCAAVHHGFDVETREDGFIEGAWDGEFERFDFDRAETVAGTGARVRDGRLVFVTPSHPLERLFVARRESELVVSNSLVFALAATGDALDPAHARYFFELLAQTRSGIDAPAARLRTKKGHVVESFVHCNLEVTGASQLARRKKPLGPPPASYGELFQLLHGAVTRVAANAASPERRKTYSLVAACSRGYDSTAAAALASLAGCREGVTFVESRHPLGHPLTGLRYEAHDDCGTPVLTALGIEAREFDRNGIHAIPGYPRAEFFLSPVGVTDMSTVVMEPWLRGRVLVSGRHGERYWSLRMSSRRHNLAETDDVHLSGGALAEFRLRAGFLHFPVPYIGALHGCALHGITHSEEMRPWRLGTRYDRPIARRIAEQAGVPRHMFGQLKMGAGQMSRSLDGESYRDFLAYVEAHVPERLRRRLDYRLLDDRVENHYKLRYLRTNYSYPPAAGRLLTFVGSERLHMLWNSVYLYQFHWGAAKIAGRYDIFSSHGG